MHKRPLTSVELFAGAGGLALGVESAGFLHDAVIEWDNWACETIRQNQTPQFSLARKWPLHQCDVRTFDFSSIKGGIDLVSGGPPCQPFSIGGKHKGYNDDRDMFPAAINSVRTLKPRAFLFENVPGLARASFAKYLKYILMQLSYPEISRRPQESWSDHCCRIEKHAAVSKHKGLSYHVQVKKLNAADYGVPQKRVRLLMVGLRNDLDIDWTFPRSTHSQEALLTSLWITGDYWERHKVAFRNRPKPDYRHATRLAKLRERPDMEAENGVVQLPWRTIRDALVGLPEPYSSNSVSMGVPNHGCQFGARSYQGHTGSPLDEPAKTLKAGDHGVPGGENMILLPNGSLRYFTVRESARLQTFPDDFIFHGSWTETMRQLGNAVPVALAFSVAKSIAKSLSDLSTIATVGKMAIQL